jgi:hypothetical protein
MYRPVSGHKKYIVMALIFYFLAKIFEVLDAAVFGLLAGMISGHSLKHILAAVGLYYVTKMFLEAKR